MMSQPLAERLRPKTLDDYIGQKHLVGQGAVLRKMIDAGRVPSFILWGPPGVGKTTLAQIIANKLDAPFYTLSAISSGVKDVREVIEKAKSNRFFNTVSPILFIDEIHRFSKSQQDSLLNAVETGVVTLIGATTENPSFEVIRPLLSRCQVYVLKSLDKNDLLTLLHKAIAEDVVLKDKNIRLTETDAMLRYSGGDARKLLNILELVVSAEERDDIEILDEKVTSKGKFYYQKSGKIRMEYAQPVNYLIVINDSRLKIVSDGKKSVMSLTANKMMNQMQDMLTACMIGDLSRISSDYKLEYFENDSYYIVKIKPVNKAIQAYISEIEIHLDKKDISVYKLRLSETATNYTEYEFYNKRFNALKDETKFSIR